MHPKVSTGQIEPLKNLSTLLIEFFQLYGVLFNLEDVGICVKGKGQYYQKVRWRDSYVMMIQWITDIGFAEEYS